MRQRVGSWLGALILIGPLWAMQAQPRYGAAFFLQSSEPTVGVYAGALWFDTSTDALKVRKSDSTWTTLGSGGAGGLPSGAIVLIDSGTCPTGTTEVAGLDAKFLRGTLASHADVGGTGGSDTATPAGTVTITNQGVIAWPAGVPTNGGIGLGTFVNTATATTGNCAATNIAAGTGSTTACKATAPNLTVPAEGHSGALTTPTISWPAGVPTHSGTAATFGGTSLSVTPAYVKVIYCQAD